MSTKTKCFSTSTGGRWQHYQILVEVWYFRQETRIVVYTNFIYETYQSSFCRSKMSNFDWNLVLLWFSQGVCALRRGNSCEPRFVRSLFGIRGLLTNSKSIDFYRTWLLVRPNQFLFIFFTRLDTLNSVFVQMQEQSRIVSINISWNCWADHQVCHSQMIWKLDSIREMVAESMK